MKRRKYVVTRKKKQGFSLVELLVATALFTTVVAISAGSFLSILEASRQSRELNNLMLAVDFAMEDMSRTMRTGRDFPIGSYNNSRIEFKDEDKRTVYYRLRSNAIEKKVVGTGGYRYTPLTPADIIIKELTFSLDSATPDQPRIIINVVGRLGSNPDDTFYLQTSVTQRELNVTP
ncbi:MAG: prepilin-type N-terminal cleavage/methylation domain-containing protein [Candidatus Paceibacterota bacterium]